jgi:NAD(P)-dependent dehydrogenase (short-subunit alcohol dehydrogenase family)
MAKWMSSKGARHIVLTSRNATRSNEIQTLREQVAVAGTHIHVKACDISDSVSVEKLVKEGLIGLPPIRGVIHGAMVLRVSNNQKPQTYTSAFLIVTLGYSF